MSINRGDIFYVNPSETVGSEQRSGRPAIIVSNPLCNEQKKRSTWCSSSFVVQKEPCPYYWTRLLL